MASNGLFAEVAALAGEPGRASMMHALMDGRALTATELAGVAGITPQTASGHLSRMIRVGLSKSRKAKATSLLPTPCSKVDAPSGRNQGLVDNPERRAALP